MGLTPSQYVALAARPTTDSPTFSNSIFQKLLDNKWEPVLIGNATAVDPVEGEYRVAGGEETVQVGVWVLLRDAKFRRYVRQFAESEGALKEAFASAWTYLMNADRFKGPNGNVCA